MQRARSRAQGAYARTKGTLCMRAREAHTRTKGARACTRTRKGRCLSRVQGARCARGALRKGRAAPSWYAAWQQRRPVRSSVVAAAAARRWDGAAVARSGSGAA